VAEVNLIFSAGATAAEEPQIDPIPAPEIEPARASGNGNGNGSGTGFRNIYLSGSQRPVARVEAKPEIKQESKPETKIVAKVDAKPEPKNQSNGVGNLTTQLEAERHERRRLEARVLSLNDQLQQVHAQLKSSLESESIYQKRVLECEEGLKRAEEMQAAAEAALDGEKEQCARLEGELAKFQSAAMESAEERNAWQEKWLLKLASALTAMQESDARLAEETEKRRDLQKTLRGLHEDFCAEADKQIEAASVESNLTEAADA
jgi:hypothetical protein